MGSRRLQAFLLVLLLLLLVGGVFLLVRMMLHERSGQESVSLTSGVAQVIVNPPQGINGVREETFNIVNGFARSFDGDDLVGWKNAQNVQVRGLVTGWSGDTLTVKLGGGTLAMKISDPVRYYCFPTVVPGADGGEAVKTSTLYTPIRDPGSVGRMVSPREAALNLIYSTPPTEKFYFS